MKALLLAASVLACIMRAAATPTGDAPAPVRLAVLADDALAETRALADLLTVELTKLAGVETVERGEVERVLAEHELTAAGVVSTEGRIALGRLLGAQGLVIVGYDAHGGRWLTRLVETRQGFLAAMFGTPHANQNPVDAARFLSHALPAHLSKLASAPERLTGASLLGFAFSVPRIGYDRETEKRHHLAEDRFRNILPNLLAERISQEKGFLVFERPRMGELLDESALTGELPRFQSTGLLIDGELSLATGSTTPETAHPVTLTIRIRDAFMRNLRTVQTSGSLDALDPLFAAAVSETLDALKTIRDNPAAAEAGREAEALLALSKEYGEIWAAEAAVALDPSSKEKRDMLLQVLLNHVGRQVVDARQLAVAFARLERLCREDNRSLLAFWTPNPARSYIRANLLHGQLQSDPELRLLMQPFRERMLQELAALKRPQQRYAFTLDALPALFPSPQQRERTFHTLFATISADTSMPAREREVLCAVMIAQHHWSQEALLPLTHAADPVIRYFANVRLLRFYLTRAERRPFALAALRDLDAILAREHLFVIGSTGVFNIGSLCDGVIRLIGALPEHRDDLVRRVFGILDTLCQQSRYGTIYQLDYAFFLSRLPRTEASRWIDDMLAKTEPGHPDHKAARKSVGNPYYFELFTAALRDLREQDVPADEAVGDVRPVSDSDTAFRRRVLLSPQRDGDAWRFAFPPELDRHWRAMSVYPQRLLIEQDTLWIALGGNVVPDYAAKTGSHPSGLLQVDLRSETLRSLAYGRLTGEEGSVRGRDQGDPLRYLRDKDERRYSLAILPVFRWRDWIVVAQSGLGVLLYPARPSAPVSGLDDIPCVNRAAGLFNNYIYAATALNDHLYVLVTTDFYNLPRRRILMQWSAASRQALTLLDLGQQITPLGLESHHKQGVALRSDPDQNRVILTCKVWERLEAEHLRGFRGAEWGFTPGANAWHPVEPHAAPTKLVAPAPTKQPPAWPLNDEETLAVAVYGQGILALTGAGPDWRLEWITRPDQTAAGTREAP